FPSREHWGQIVVGLFYYSITGRRPLGMEAELHGEMVIISLICVGILIVGIVMGDALVARPMKPRPTREIALSWANLLVFYFALLAFRGTLRDYAWNVSAGLTQGVLAITYDRFALFYLILRRLVYLRRWAYASGFVLL